jgi:hypothetical protein
MEKGNSVRKNFKESPVFNQGIKFLKVIRGLNEIFKSYEEFKKIEKKERSKKSLSSWLLLEQTYVKLFEEDIVPGCNFYEVPGKLREYVANAHHSCWGFYQFMNLNLDRADEIIRNYHLRLEEVVR